MSATSNPESSARWLPFQFSIRSLLIAIAFVALFLSTNGFFGLVGLFYPRYVDNAPLTAPVRVVSVGNNTIQLEDGRVIVVDTIGQSLDEMIQASDGRRDAERINSCQGICEVSR